VTNNGMTNLPFFERSDCRAVNLAGSHRQLNA
jgi:hypothetical protein